MQRVDHNVAGFSRMMPDPEVSLKYFDCLATGVNIQPLLEEIGQQDVWHLSTSRQDTVAVQREAAAIPLRGLVKSKIRGRRTQDVHDSRDTGISAQFPIVMAWLNGFATNQHARLGRAKIVNLPPGAVVYEHVDRGEYYEVRDRYHLVLRSYAGSPLSAGDETVRMQEGELWWFNNKQIHAAHNDSKDGRIHLIFDLKPRSPRLARSYRQLLAPLISTSTDLRKDIELSAREARGEVDVISRGILLYLAVRRKPNQWNTILANCGFEGRDGAPFRALATLLLPQGDAESIRDCGRTMSWVMAQMETGALQWAEVETRINELGGITDVAKRWQAQRHLA